MAKLSMVRIRSFFASVFAIILVILFASVSTAVMGIDLPVLGTIARTLGFDPADAEE